MKSTPMDYIVLFFFAVFTTLTIVFFSNAVIANDKAIIALYAVMFSLGATFTSSSLIDIYLNYYYQISTTSQNKVYSGKIETLANLKNQAGEYMKMFTLTLLFFATPALMLGDWAFSALFITLSAIFAGAILKNIKLFKSHLLHNSNSVYRVNQYGI